MERGDQFAPVVKTKAYGHDLLTTFGQTKNGTRVDITADQIMSLHGVRRVSSKELSISCVSSLKASDVSAAANLCGIDTGSLEVSLGNAKLFKPIKDEEAAKTAAVFETVSQLSELDQKPDFGPVIAEQLGRPTGVYLPGANIINPDGSHRSTLNIPRILLVEVRVPGEKRTIPQPYLEDSFISELQEVRTIEQLVEASADLMERYQEGEQIIADLHELKNELPELHGFIPTVDTGVGIPFAFDNDGFNRATQMRAAIKELIPSTQCYIGRSWAVNNEQ